MRNPPRDDDVSLDAYQYALNQLPAQIQFQSPFYQWFVGGSGHFLTPDWQVNQYLKNGVDPYDERIPYYHRRVHKLRETLRRAAVTDPDYLYSLMSREERKAEVDGWRDSPGARDMGILGWGLLGGGSFSSQLKKRENPEAAPGASPLRAPDMGSSELDVQSRPRLLDTATVRPDFKSGSSREESVCRKEIK
ncbi:hypothetical protein TWF696_004613 [Orbilia brochopaga]|uniref:Uncharacterized protein n=1 Tax=Orbilia brochopaga TaxID=3140254 RepID=A0AAV9V7F5_9PEZI